MTPTPSTTASEPGTGPARRPSRSTLPVRPERRGDGELIQACLAGSQSAWDELVERYGRLIYSIPRRYGMGDADADDVFQSVWVVLYRKIETLRDVERLSSWIITTTHRECWRVGRRSQQAAGEIDRQIADVGAPRDDDVQVWEEQQLVREALRRLGGRCERLLTALFTAQGPSSYEEVARQLDMPVGSIGPIRARCFRKLEKILIELGLEGSPEPCE